VLVLSLAVPACGRSEPDQGGTGGGGTSGCGRGGAGGTGTIDAGSGGAAGAADGAAPTGGPIGWAAVAGNGVTTTTGGDGGATVTVTTLADLNAAVLGSTPRVVQISEQITGSVTSIAANKTLVGLPGASIHGHLQLGASVNVIVRNLTIVGNNCTDSPTDCSMGADAITIDNRAHHIWFDHDDISDGSDGNLDITTFSNAASAITSRGNLLQNTTGTTGDIGGAAFTPPYAYTLDPAASVQALVMAGVGPQ
jgi:pectate lyase